MKVADIPALDRILVIGSVLRKEQPLLAQRFRLAVRKRAQFNLINPVDDDLLMRVANKAIAAPGALAAVLAQVVKAAAEIKAAAVPAAVAGMTVGPEARKIAESLATGQNRAIFLGNLAQHHPRASELHRLAQELARIVDAKIGFFGEAANSVGGYLAGATPVAGTGMDAAQMLAQPRKAYLLLHAEMDFDTVDPRAARAAMQSAELVVAMSPFRHALDYAQVLLPVSPFTETGGSFVNTEGRVQNFQGVVRPLGETRPAWKVLRVLGTLLELPGFEYDTVEAVRTDCVAAVGDMAARLDNTIQGGPGSVSAGNGRGGIERIGEVPIYHVDGMVRRAESLQLTRDAQVAVVSLPGGLVDRLGLRQGRSRAHRPGRRRSRAALPAGRPVARELRAHTRRLPGHQRAGRAVRRDRARARGRAGKGERMNLAFVEGLIGADAVTALWTLAKIVAITVPIILSVAYLTYFERKVIGFMQVRIGPNRVGYRGLLQPFADVLKLLAKEIIIPSGANKFLFIVAPVLSIMPALAAWAVVPFTPDLVLARADAGLLYVMAITSMGVYGVIVAGWASNSKYAFIGGLRSAAQIVSYEIAMGFALVCVLMMSGSLNLSTIVMEQSTAWGLLGWNLIPLFPMFLVYFIAGVAETNRAPFDVAEGESEIVAGFHVEYSGTAFAVFFLAEYANMILVAALASIMFLGGWLSPLPSTLANSAGMPWLAASGFPWFLLKIAFLLFCFLWFRATFPRYRYDQIMRLGWKVFIPLTIVWLVLIGGLMQFSWWPW